MANHRATAALLLIASLFVAVAISRADARLTKRPNKMTALGPDAHGRGYIADAVASRQPEPTCDDCEQPKPEPEPQPEPQPEPEPEPEPKRKPEPEPEPEPKSELTCNKVHGVQAGETCCSIGEGAGLTQDQFLGFNPNLCCEKVFVGQWVCLEATSGCHD